MEGSRDILDAVSAEIGSVFKQFYGRAPAHVKSYHRDDLAICVLRGGFTQVEQALHDGGRGDAVVEQRLVFHELMRERFCVVIERAMGRPVIACMCDIQQSPDVMCEVFVLAPAPT